MQKTKIVIFSRGKSRRVPLFNFNNNNLEVVTNFPYLGITFNYNGKFNLCQAQKAMYSVLRKCRKVGPPIVGCRLHG